MNGIAERITKLVAEELAVGVDDVKPESTFDFDLGADSIDRMQLTLKIEEAFAIELPDKDASKMRTVGELIDYVTARAATV